MIIALGFLGLIILGVSFGRNSLGNIFGSAIGTGALSLPLCSILMTVCIFCGAILGEMDVSHNVQSYLHFTQIEQVGVFSLIVAGIIWLFNKCGCPISIAQITMGGLLGWNVAHSIKITIHDLTSLFFVWMASPVISGIIAFIVFRWLRFYFQHHAVALLHRDNIMRIYMILSGCFISYMLGKNNLSVIYMPFMSVYAVSFIWGLGVISMCILLGGLLAQKRLIQMLSHDLFPLSPMESMIMLMASGLTLALFSTNLPGIPALPISSSASLIGAIVGISIAKGGYGLNVKSLHKIMGSWLWAPCVSGIICYIVGRGLS